MRVLPPQEDHIPNERVFLVCQVSFLNPHTDFNELMQQARAFRCYFFSVSFLLLVAFVRLPTTANSSVVAIEEE